MLKKLLYFSIILIMATLLLNVCYATDISAELNTIRNSTTDTSASITDDVYDNTTYSPTTDDTIYDDNTDTSDLVSDASQLLESATTTSTDYEDSTQLSLTNMINIILIVVGVVLILLGIAIVLKLK